jgi:hypothetical protein
MMNRGNRKRGHVTTIRGRRVVNAIIVGIVFVLLIPSNLVWAMHPLITDDTGTQGKGKFQFEKNGQYDYDKETNTGVTVKATGGVANNMLTYGAIDPVDIILNMPFLWIKVRENDIVTANAKGLTDTTLEVKWRFFEKNGFSFALKPGLIIPTGDHEKGLGAGKVGYTTFIIMSKDMEPWSFHANLGYKRNESTEDLRSDIWHASAAVVRAVTKDLKLVADLGIETNSEKECVTDPAYILAGIVYSLKENLDLDLGVKYGLTRPETNYSFLAGMTVRF